MAFVSRSANSGSQLSRGAQALGSAVRFQEGALTLSAYYVQQVATYKFSSRFLVFLDLFKDAAAETHVPTVRCVDGSVVKLYTAAPDGTWLDVHVAHEKVDDPSGTKLFNGRVASISQFHRLAVPHRLYAQQQLGIMVGSLTAPEARMVPIRLINVFVEPYEPVDAKTKQPKGYTSFSVRAGGYLPAAGGQEHATWPLPDRMRFAMPYELQMLPTRDELFTDDRYKPAPFARLASAAAVPPGEASAPATEASVGGDGQEGTGARLLAPVRLSVDAFPLAGAADDAEPVYVLPSEEYTLAGAVAQGVSVVATKVPVWSTRGVPVGKPEDNKWRKPRMGGALVLGVTLARDLDGGGASPAANKTVAAEVHFYAEHVVNAPSWFMPLHDAIVTGTQDRPPVPFVLVAAVNTAKSQLEQRTSSAFRDGLLTVNLTQAPVWRIREYVERYCIAVSQDTIYGRFAKGQGRGRFVPDKDKVEYWYDDALEGKTDRQEASLVRYDRLDNADRCVLLDLLIDEMPDADRWPDGTRFFAMPLYDKGASAPLPRAPAPDPAADAAGVPLAQRPWQCALTTPEAGDAYVRAELAALGRLPANTVALGDALAARPALIFPDQPNVKTEGDYVASLPYFCFWAVLPVPAAAHAPAVPQPSRVRSAATMGKPEVVVPKRERAADDEDEDTARVKKEARYEPENDDPIEEDFDA